MGLAVDETLAQLMLTAVGRSLEVQFVDLSKAVLGKWRFSFNSGVSAEVHYGGNTLLLSPDDSYFCRVVDLSGEPEFASHAQKWLAFIATLNRWLEAATGRVVNKPMHCLHNGSKPLHEAVLQSMGFRVPASIASCDLSRLLDFVRAGPTVSKPICGERADCVSVNDKDLETFVPQNGPIHLQRFVAGVNVRIHVIGEHVVGQRVQVDGTDYRKLMAIREMKVFDVPVELRRHLVAATMQLGLAFAGWDFIIDHLGDYWCLEANPMPGYLPYDLICEGAITMQVLRYLQG